MITCKNQIGLWWDTREKKEYVQERRGNWMKKEQKKILLTQDDE